jgi:hypothetical protein
MALLVKILIIIALLPSLALAGSPAPLAGPDGSLVLKGDETKQNRAGSGDTLHVLLTQEVQAFVYRSHTRVWPQPWIPRSAPTGKMLYVHPQLEPLIQKYAALYRVDPSLIRAVMRHESGFNPGAVSPKGAQGLMQLMPGTAALMGVRNPFNPEENIAGGVGYLRFCLDRFQHNVPLAVAAYNAGPERVAQSGAVPAISETQLFVQNVMGSYLGRYQPGGYPGGAMFVYPTPGKNLSPDKPAGKKRWAKARLAQEDDRPRPKIIEVRPAKNQPAPKAESME